MSDNVVSLASARDERRLLWACSCGCTAHHAYADGAIECASCGLVGRGIDGEWRARLPEEPSEPKELNTDNFKIVNLGSSESFLRRHTKDEDVRFVVIARDDGSQSTWSHDVGGTPEREAWLDRQFDKARRQIVPGPDSLHGKSA